MSEFSYSDVSSAGGSNVPPTGNGQARRPRELRLVSTGSSAAERTADPPPWKVLIADDDRSVHAVTRLVLGDFRFKGRPLQLFDEYTAAGAIEVLRKEPGIAAVLLDVVMETDHAGLDVVRYVRETLGDSHVRLILRTGQPGQAPEDQVIADYDVNDYREKSDLTAQKLITSLTTALRAYEDIRAIRELSVSNEALDKAIHDRTRDLASLNDRLRRSQNLLAEAQRIAGIGNYEWNLAGGTMSWSEEARRILDLPGEVEDSGLNPILAATAPEDAQRVDECLATALTSHRPFEIEHRIVRRDGAVRHVRQQGEAQYDEHGEPVRLVGILQDITAQRDAQQAMRKLSTAVEQTAHSVMITDREGVIEYVNPAFTAMTGFTREEALGRTPRMLRSGRQDAAAFGRLWEAILRGQIYSDVLVNRRKDGTEYHEAVTITPQRGARGEITHFIGTGRDVTEWVQVHRRIEHMAHHDALTGLPNRILLADRLAQALARAKWHERHVAVAFLDIDRFKVINDSLGHDVGDELLKGMARRLEGCVREGDTVARLGGDEFAIVLNDLATREDVTRMAVKIIEATKTPFHAGARDLFVTTSIGIAMFPEDGDDGQALLKRADQAMYGAKAGGRNTYRFYAQRDEQSAIARLDLETALRHALHNEEFFLAFQPQVDVADGRISAVEALLRWRRPDGRIVPPLEFIAVLDDAGMGPEVGDWVLRTACAAAQRLDRSGLPALRVAVNVSLRQFRQPGFAARLAQILGEAGFDAQRLELEISEGVLTDDAQIAIQTLHELHAMGVRLAIDDFGTGYSSMHFLGRLPFDALKIDGSFVSGLPADRDSAAVATAIHTLAHALGMETVAEGVATAAQRRFLADLGCRRLQGDLISPPLELPGLVELARGGHGRA